MNNVDHMEREREREILVKSLFNWTRVYNVSDSSNFFESVSFCFSFSL